MKKRTIALLAGILALLFLMSACSLGGADKGNEDSPDYDEEDIWEEDEEQEEDAEDEEDDREQEREPAAEQPTLSTEEVSPETAPEVALPTIPESPLSDEEILARYEPVFEERCPRGCGVLLADLTWDGIPEMLVTYTKESELVDNQQALDIYSIQDDQVNLIRQVNARSISGEWAEWCLYTDEDGRNYLVSDTGGSAIYLSYLDENGDLVRVREESWYILQQGTTLLRERYHYNGNEHFASSAVLMSLSSEDQRKVNIFLSNFSEQEFMDFERDVSPEAQMIEFAFMQLKINSSSAVKYQNGYMVLSADTLENTTERFFGRTPERGSTDWLTYSNGSYSSPAADGAFTDYVTVVQEMYDLENGTYEVVFVVYENYTNQDQYSLTPDQAEGNSGLIRYASGAAVLEDSIYNGNASYHLISYQVD